jgi:hypothetical protein
MIKSTTAVIVVLMSLLTSVPACFGQAAAARTAAKELIEAILEKGGREAAQELAEMGGEKAVREVLEKAAREGGEALAGRAAQLGRAQGFAALRVIEHSPGRWVNVLEQVSPDLVKPAIRAAQREPQLLTKLVTTYGKEAVEVAARHPGVGARLVDQLGRDGIELGLKLGTDDAIILARYAVDVAKLAPAPRAEVLAKIAKSPAAVLKFLESHPRVLATAAGVATVLAVKDQFLGESGQRITQPDGTIIEPAPGLIERMTDRVLNRFQTPIGIGLALLGLILLGWGAIQLWHLWRIKQIKQAAARTEAGR